MAGGFLGLPQPWATSPLADLTAMAQGGGEGSPTPPPSPAPTAAPADPATTGSIPASTQSGGGSSRGLGDMLGDAVSGRGLFGAREGDERVDPNTGVTQGQSRQMSMQSMMGMGLTLLAAGMRQSDDSRAAILSRAPGMLDQSGQLNNFAKMRLEMANARLKEREVNNADERTKRWNAIFGGSGAATGASPAGAPAALPGTIAPAGGPVAAGGAAPGPVAAPGPAAAPGGAPGGDLLNGVSPGIRTLLGALGPEKGLEKFLEIRRGLDEQEVMGEPRLDQATGKMVADKIKNGQRTGIVVIGDQREFAGPETVDPDTGTKRRDIMRGGDAVRSENLGTVARPLDIETGADGRQFQVRKNAQGQVIERTAIPEAREDATTQARAKQYVDMEGTIRTQAREGSSMLRLLNEFQGAIDDPNVYFGAGADKVAGAKSIAKAFGMDVEGVDNTNLAQKVTNQLALRVRNPEGGFGGMPGSTSDRDVTFLLQSVPSLMATREGAQLVKDTFAAMAERNVEIDKMRRAYVKKNGKLDAAFEDMVADKFDEPLLSESQRKAIERAAAKTPPAATPTSGADPSAAPAATNVGDVVDGHRYKGGPRGLPSSWEKVN